MTTPIFIQTSKHVIDVAKVTYVELHAQHGDGVCVHFVAGTLMWLTHDEAEQLLEEVRRLGQNKHLVFRRAPNAEGGAA